MNRITAEFASFALPSPPTGLRADSVEAAALMESITVRRDGRATTVPVGRPIHWVRLHAASFGGV